MGNDGFRLRLDLEGHPTDCILRAHDIGQSVFRDLRWHIFSIQAELPRDYEHPSEMRMKVIIVAFDT